MDDNFFSVIVPTYEPQEYLFECIDCLTKQTLSYENFEVLIILNGRKQPYFNQISIYINGKQNFKLVYCDQAGVSNARNIGINKAKGSHIIFVDDDDLLPLEYLAEFYKLSRITPTAVIFSNFLRYYGPKRIEDDYMTYSYKKILESQEGFSLIKYRKLLSSSCGKALPVTTIRKVRFREDMRISEDALFMFEISKDIKSATLGPLDVSYFRRIRPFSASRVNQRLYKRISVFWRGICGFSKVYFCNPAEYNFIFYINRLLAISKHFILGVVKTNNQIVKGREIKQK